MSQPPSNPPAGQNTCSAQHPHEPGIPPVFAPDGHCRVCRLLVDFSAAIALERDAKENIREQFENTKAQLATAREDMKEECAKVCAFDYYDSMECRKALLKRAAAIRALK